MLALIARINYALARGQLYGFAPSLIVAIPVAIYLLTDSKHSLTELQLCMQSITFGLGGGVAAATLLGLFVSHNPRQADLQLGRKRPIISILAAIVCMLFIIIFHVSGYDRASYFPHVDYQEVLNFIRAQQRKILIGIGFCFFVGALVAPPRFLRMLALKYFTFWDVLRGCHPHHDEEAAVLLPSQKHGRLHAQDANWWAYRAEAPRARYEWAEARRLGGLEEEDYKMCASFFAAISDLNEAEKVTREGLSNYPNNVNLMYTLTDVLELQNLPGEAEAEYRKILLLDPSHAPTLHAYGNILSNQGRYDEAVEYFNRAIVVADTSDSNIVRYLNSRGSALATIGKHEEAEIDFNRAVHLGNEFRIATGEVPAGVTDAVRNLGMLHGMRTRHEDWQKIGLWAGQRQRIYEDMIELCLEMPESVANVLGFYGTERALEYVERTKSRALLDLLKASPRRSRSANISGPSQADSHKLLNEFAAVDSHAIHKALPNGCAVLEYYQARGQWLAFLIDQEKCVYLQLKQLDGVDLGKAVASLKNMLSSVVFADLSLIKEAATYLYNHLWPDDIQNRVKNCDVLYIVPHGELHGLPFVALHDGSDWLLKNAPPIVYGPSASILVHVWGEALPSKPRFVGLAFPGKPYLPDVVPEVLACSEMYPDAIVLPSNGCENYPTRDDFERLAPTADILHLACHGRLSSNPLECGFQVCGKDGNPEWVTSTDTLSIQLGAALF